MSVTLGTFIRERRQDLDLTQEQLTERIGDPVRQSEISLLEGDRIALPQRDGLAAIAAELLIAMHMGGSVAYEDTPRSNGGLFATVDVPRMTTEEIAVLY